MTPTLAAAARATLAGVLDLGAGSRPPAAELGAAGVPEALLAEAWAGWRALLLDDDPGPLGAFVAHARPEERSPGVVQRALLAPGRALLATLSADPAGRATERHVHALSTEWLLRLSEAQQVRAETASFAQAVEAEAVRAAQSTFLAHVGHEVRTPLSSILGFTQLLKSQGQSTAPDELAFCLDSLDEHAKRLLSLVDDVVELARLDAGLGHPTEEDLDLWRLLRDVHQDLRTRPEAAAGAALDITANVRRYARVDGQRLARALRCVLRTAHRLSGDAGQVHTLVDLDAQGMLRARVTDGGAERLSIRRGWFSGFAGADERLGLGVGLPIAVAARIAALLGGALDVEAKGDRHVWTLSVPLAELADVATTAETPVPPGKALERLLVVAAPDTPRDILRELCGTLGVEARFVTIEELAEGASHRPDVILAEAHPPMAVLQQVSATRGLERIPVVVTRAFGGGSSRTELRQAGVFEVLERPLDLDELTTALMDAAALTPE